MSAEKMVIALGMLLVEKGLITDMELIARYQTLDDQLGKNDHAKVQAAFDAYAAAVRHGATITDAKAALEKDLLG